MNQRSSVPATFARSFPTRADVQSAVSLIPTTTDKEWRQRKGPRYRLELSPGSVRVTATDYAKSSKADGLAMDRQLREDADMIAAELKKERKRGTIKNFSEKSQALMPLRFATIDYSAMFDQGELAAFITLTYPMEWHRIVPDATTFKQHVNALRKRYLNSWGRKHAAWAGIWKMEFQRRGAPHLHIGSTVPLGTRPAPLSQDDLTHLQECSGCYLGAHTGRFEFREWLKRHWSQIIFKDALEAPSPWSIDGWLVEQKKNQTQGVHVDTDQGMRYSDPKRIGVYFSKHGLFEDKSYQNIVPGLWREKPGARFWGYWVVRPLIVSKETHEQLIMHIVRHLRALADRSSYSRKTRVVKGGMNERTGEVWEPRARKRAVHRRVKRWRNRSGYGYIVVNDGTAMASDIGRIVSYFGAHLVREDPGESSGLPYSEISESPAEPALWAWGDMGTLDYFDQPSESVPRRNRHRSPAVEPPPVRSRYDL